MGVIRLFYLVKKDLEVNYSPISKLICISYRFANKVESIKTPIIKHILKIVVKVVDVIVKLISKCEIPSKCKIGKCFRLEHGGNGVIFHDNVVIGDNVRIFHQVTIGSNIGRHYKKGKAPIIGDNVIIGAGAKILGDVKIGNNVKIGTNAVVLKDVPDNCTAVGVPAKIIYSKSVE